MTTFLPSLAGRRADEARGAFDSMIEDVAAQTGAAPDRVRDAIAADGAQDYLQRLCLLLLDATGLSSQGAQASRRVKRVSRRLAAQHPGGSASLADAIKTLRPNANDHKPDSRSHAA